MVKAIRGGVINTDKTTIRMLERQIAQLKKKLLKYSWQSVNEVGKPEYNRGVLVFIPDEDNHITAGMWDISNKWVLLDEYRVPESEVTYWTYMPNAPEPNKI